MKCPFCENEETKVIDTRPTDEGHTIRRRRECMSCGKRFTTYEKIENIQLIVVKKDKTREVFDRTKMLNGIIRACEKRPVPLKEIERITDNIEKKLQNSLDNEITSDRIGELVMEELKNLDDVAYVRFASVYRQFKDINTFMDELKKLINGN
ncbi:transcriptional repressor NrdR [Dethiosulfatibacter aminovorans DSM 17477]|uniref:Transcriptional repressor NrdR n=1 Tax=Dethiosulfatibacter aminovorans DSM 17477 TaxID=1121476 RepID=A0A1M6DK80_9FIRM|nr:transcriptional regulator NrdR [Dethiosulfatibacter aminovorans]SHI73724.1 transcriptional repressor NrdR [Dethiosulfatibacter aminovorans DSM 17477]